MTTTEHLQLIRQRCIDLLAIAEKRTPGQWERHKQTPHPQFTGANWNYIATASTLNDDDAAFIAACPGSAEAGWRSTIAAIDNLSFNLTGNAETIKIILAAWPLKLPTNNKP